MAPLSAKRPSIQRLESCKALSSGETATRPPDFVLAALSQDQSRDVESTYTIYGERIPGTGQLLCTDNREIGLWSSFKALLLCSSQERPALLKP